MRERVPKRILGAAAVTAGLILAGPVNAEQSKAEVPTAPKAETVFVAKPTIGIKPAPDNLSGLAFSVLASVPALLVAGYKPRT